MIVPAVDRLSTSVASHACTRVHGAAVPLYSITLLAFETWNNINKAKGLSNDIMLQCATPMKLNNNSTVWPIKILHKLTATNHHTRQRTPLQGMGAFFLFFFCYLQCVNAQEPRHGKTRAVHYTPSGNDFVCINGKQRFNRALYGTNTAFRVEAGDLPEFALYMPGMGGNLKFGLVAGEQSKWLIEAASVKAIYRPGSMLYEITDPILGKGILYLTVLALADAEGMIVKTSYSGAATNAKLVWMYGGATGKKFSRDGDIGADPESSFYLQPAYCKDNSYRIDQNKFLLSYGTGKVLTEEEQYEIKHLEERPQQTQLVKNAKQLSGVMPAGSAIQQVDAAQQQTPNDGLRSAPGASPAVAGTIHIGSQAAYFLVFNTATPVNEAPQFMEQHFAKAEAARKKLAGRIKLVTPDSWLNTMGGALGIAADAIWEDPTFLHGAIAWRMRLNAWRGASVADPLGWHDRAEKHFSSYALSQVTSAPTTGVVMDTALHLARHLEKIGTALFSDGYICRNPNGDIRAHHYDMNLVFIDQLLTHFNYTGDKAYIRKMWPLLKRHLAWEKRNFDADGDGLYDAYASIWASDALQYSGGGVTHSSAYNYRSNKMAAELATILGEDGSAYKNEADKILSAIDQQLWMPKLGWYAEYKDLLGNQLVHPYPGVWTIYHTIDSKVPDAFKAFQTLQYVKNEIPRIPVQATGLPYKDCYLVATTNWRPYTWSLNNVALAENMHTALAYWQGGQSTEGYRLWKSALVESMYLSSSPGGFEQLSFYDAVRGELYRDFADPIAMVARTLVEGLFGIQPDALKNVLTIEPGFPAEWNHAALSIPDISISFKRTGAKDLYTITPSYSKKMQLQLKLRAGREAIASVTINGRPVKWTMQEDAVGAPVIIIQAAYAANYSIEITWKDRPIELPVAKATYKTGETINLKCQQASLLELMDPQQALQQAHHTNNTLTATVQSITGNKTFFVKLKQGQFSWWQPVCFAVTTDKKVDQKAVINNNTVFEKVNLSPYFNDKVNRIFKQQYLSPRPTSPTLQLPTQGIGNWCYPLITATINDEGLRKLAGSGNEIKTPELVPFSTPADSLLNNILFTSQWDNYPKQATVPLTGKASHAHLLMAGSTNAMQSRLVNGYVIVQYKDATADTLQLVNPQNWWPIEQDYINDGYAFTTGAPIPLRLYLTEGKFAYGLEKYSSIKGFSNRAIEGGAATVLDMPLNPSKELQSLSVKTMANDVVIGLMSVTLQKSPL